MGQHPKRENNKTHTETIPTNDTCRVVGSRKLPPDGPDFNFVIVILSVERVT